MNWGLLKSKINACWHILRGYGKPSFSQVGEDRIIHYYFASRGITKPTYLDIGTNDPVMGSNTFFFYSRGARGVCIEPEPALFKKVKTTRPGDICLNVGIGLKEATAATFYIYPERLSGWNTFSEEEVAIRRQNGYEFEKTLQIPLKNVNDIIAEHIGNAPDLLSIDVEGLDFDILKSLDFSKYAPRVAVVETIRFGDTLQSTKQQDIIEFMLHKGYSIYADTYVNTIFVKTIA
jgi:FkbM family methyltransferase